MSQESGTHEPVCELTILMPCLNEVETLAICVDKARAFLARSGIEGEVLIADNGSTDGSIEIAHVHGARVIHVPIKGYGAALKAGIQSARGRYVVMGDSDDSYDFGRLEPFVEKLRQGFDLVMGNRFRGGIAPGAMPPLHKYLGNPVLSFIGRLFFSIPVGDFHCGLRGFNRGRILALDLNTPGMEFASEMVVRSALNGYRITEVSTTLSPDGRSRPPHLRTWRDGWRHLRFMLLFSPRWLFLYPGIAILTLGAILTFVLLPGPVSIAQGVVLDIHSMIVGCIAMLIGTQCISFAVVARRYAASRGLLPAAYPLRGLMSRFSLESALLLSAVLFLAGLVGMCYCVSVWWRADFGPLQYGSLVRVLILSATVLALAMQTAFTSFLAAMLDVKLGSPERSP